MLSIVKLVAADSLTAHITRLLSSFQNSTACKRKPNENLSIFLSHFSGLAAKHFVHAQTPPLPQTEQALAITLLNNADLGEGTLTY